MWQHSEEITTPITDLQIQTYFSEEARKRLSAVVMVYVKLKIEDYP